MDLYCYLAREFTISFYDPEFQESGINPSITKKEIESALIEVSGKPKLYLDRARFKTISPDGTTALLECYVYDDIRKKDFHAENREIYWCIIDVNELQIVSSSSDNLLMFIDCV